MKKAIYFFFLALSSIWFTGCQKVLDQWKPGGGQNKQCSLKKITQSHLPVGGETKTGTFYYGQNNRPDSLIFDLYSGAGVAQLYY
ncbi:MAG TPA: hypothetical protein PK339_09270 [Flavitalea sp.]|nr:hypothetical protein [Flavitalea sp.]